VPTEVRHHTLITVGRTNAGLIATLLATL